MSHTCKAALVRCMDFRLEPTIHHALLEGDLLGNVDIISVAGAAKDIAQTDSSFAESQVDLSHKLHQTTEVILMNHTDCGGYGGRGAFESREAERAQHEADLHTAKDKLMTKYPELVVRLMIADIAEDGTVKIEDVA